MMHWRNNYARIDVGILYRLYLWMVYMYAHNNSVQSVGHSEQKIAMCIQKNSFRIGFFIDNDFKSVTKLHNSNETYLRRWEKNAKIKLKCKNN